MNIHEFIEQLPDDWSVRWLNEAHPEIYKSVPHRQVHLDFLMNIKRVRVWTPNGPFGTRQQVYDEAYKNQEEAVATALRHWPSMKSTPDTSLSLPDLW